jgi:hypothetical protein
LVVVAALAGFIPAATDAATLLPINSLRFIEIGSISADGDGFLTDALV